MSLLQLLRAWLVVGTQSIGGSAFVLIRIVFVDRNGWISRRDFTEAWALAQLGPGIHLISLAGIIGHRLAGVRGMIVSVAGMVIPASAIAVILSIGFAAVATHPIAQAALAGIVPVTAGMTGGMAIYSAREAVRRGKAAIADLSVSGFAFLILMAFPGSTIAVILSAALVGALFLGRDRPTTSEASR